MPGLTCLSALCTSHEPQTASSVSCADLQVLYAHIFGVTLLDEQETVWGILGSLLIASGVVTVNGAKGHNSSAAFEHPSLLPMFQYTSSSTADRNATGYLHKAGKVTSAAPSGVAENGAEETSVCAQGSSGFLQALLARIKHVGRSAAGSSGQREVSNQQLELAEGLGTTYGRTVTAGNGAASSAWDSDMAGQPMPGPTPYTSVAQQDDSEEISSGGGEGAEVSHERRRVRGVGPEGQSGGFGSLRDRERSWAGEWAFRREVDGSGLAPAMARYYQLLGQNRQ